MLFGKINKMNRYPAPNSVVDTLKSNGYPSSFDDRKYIYENTYRGHYTDLAPQNIRINNNNL